MTTDLRLPFDDAPDSPESRIDARDRAGRQRAVDPRFNVALEASAGTGKTRVLVDRYINLLREGVDPSNILAITFTRKAAAEMRDRIVTELRAAADRGEFTASRWRELRDRTGDIAISTIDAFCLSLLREFPLEADLDPGFSIADDTEVPRLVDESLDRALRVCRAIARDDEHVALVFAQLGDRRVRAGLAALLNRRLVAPAVLSRYLARSPRDFTLGHAARRGAERLMDVFHGMRGGLERFLETGPPEPAFVLLARELRGMAGRMANGGSPDPVAVHVAYARAREHFLTQDGSPRNRLPFAKTMFASPADWQAHRDLVIGHAPAIASTYAAYRRDLNLMVSRGVWRMFRIAETEYRRTLETHAVVDFPDVLQRALDLLRQMEEFAQSRYRLESRYHHVLVDEFQDTSRAQWELVSLLVASWGEGAGLTHSGPLQPSIFIVGDRKQSIYGFRDADVSILREASRHLESLRGDRDVRRSISRSFRSVPALLSFVNDLFQDVDKASLRRDAFEYTEEDRFPAAAPSGAQAGEALALVVADSPEGCADATAAEIERLIAQGINVRDRGTGVPRPVRPGDFGILFRTRESHREFEEALARRRIPSYVYKGLGFFDADEIKDVLALLWYLADPLADLRAAALMRSRIIRMSDESLRLLAPRLADALHSTDPPAAAARLDARDRDLLDAATAASARWLKLVDRMPPAELLDTILTECAYAAELRGPRFPQARENLKKIRALIRRIQNRGYATLGRIAAHLDRLSAGDEANAVIDASDAVNLMTVHAAKGLEFPIVFVVNLARGTGNRRDPIRVAVQPHDDDVSVSVGDFLSEADDDDAGREMEETKRLLYVALTRARDRLYLGSVLKDGRLQPGRGSLAEVLPASFSALFDQAAAGVGAVCWPAVSGVVHTLAVCVPAPIGDPRTATSAMAAAEGPDTVPAPPGDFFPLHDDVPRRVAAADPLLGSASGVVDAIGRVSGRLVGTIVHRLLQRFGVSDDVSDEMLIERIRSAIDSAEPGEVDRADLAREAVDVYRRLCRRRDLRALYSSGPAYHEVPFVMQDAGGLVRGTIDCLVRGPGDRVTVLEFKTGHRRVEHEAQSEVYRKAAQAVFPGAVIDAWLLYADEVEAP